jgi:hypothetical protein
MLRVIVRARSRGITVLPPYRTALSSPQARMLSTVRMLIVQLLAVCQREEAKGLSSERCGV